MGRVFVNLSRRVHDGDSMVTPTSLFDYELPEELIAQHSVEPRDHSRLMVVDRVTGAREHKRFYEIVDELHSGDVLVMNNTKVFRARLEATVVRSSLRGAPRRSNPSIELFLLRPRAGVWEALVKPGRHVEVGDTIRLGDLEGSVISKSDIVTINFVRSDKIILDYANVYGQIPIPPYVHEIPKTLEEYQTVYAQETGSVAAPTAGFHFTQELLEKIHAKGIEIHYVTLHVGLGTFRPMKSETLEEHQMHSEFVTIDSNTAQAINRAKQEGRRVIAVGTTTVRTLEGVAALHHGHIEPFTGDVDLFITPGFAFTVVDALITNFHLPKSTLLVLVSAFAGREHILASYQEAVRERYRFFSFGDAMFLR
ncbi:MAG: S-adenosylmethionine:tRNA ribosyltransferase-isomerase [Candidatus Uhrbacteria bacterium GW2011_GWA2_52_8d]|uniref:S-adenosylmethionine:tRNA ribosyltransferase-isomerase n=1 Tax=Candidatus Uhrbacteria bacterium GW2011_GWA2_52_8d TaxID=1618979 RepID=A0A0G1XLP9_9BACT|nr:MAG: S-adenosylmethionine:tRNA ribosyltransferase-isomerase [Candidatus Uhrbacteria bacterium GW2011_GWA2_52_8d]